MKANIFIRIFLLSSLALMAACAEEEPCDEGVATTLHASIEQPAVTKTALSGPASRLYKTLWVENDKIAVYANGGTAGAEFSLTNGAETNNGEFKGNIPSGSRIAVYPYSICSEASGNTIKVVLPEEQQYKPGNIPDNAYPMVASPSESILRFKNLCSVLKISMTGDLTVNSILFLANNSNVMVSGNATIDAENTALTMSSDAGSRLVLKCDGVKLSDTATDFFIVVPSQTYTGGFSLTIDTDKGKVLKTIQSDVTLKRSELYRISPFECKIDEDNNNIIFEDTHFKAYMIANFDKDKDGEISFDEALSVTSITVCTDTIASLAGIEHMTNLTYLSCNGSHVWNSTTAKYDDGGTMKNLDISQNTNLTTLYCNYNQLTSLDVSKNTELSTLHCNYNQFTSLDVTNNTYLSTLYCEGIDLDGIDIRNNPLLSILGADGNRLSTIDLTNNPKLSYLSLTSNKLTTIDVSKNSELQYFYVGYNELTSIDVSRNPELMFIHCQNNQLTSIDISNNSKLIGLGCYNNSISELDVTKNTKLTSLDFENNQISSIDLKNCPDIKYLCCSDNKLKSLKVNSCPKITVLWVHNNSLEVLDISKLTDLERFYSSPNTLLKTLYVYSGQIDKIKYKSIPSTTKIVVGSEPDDDKPGEDDPDDNNPDGWEGREFWHKSLGIRFTATWCGYCPNLATGFAKAVSQYPNKLEMLNLHPTSSQLGFSGTSAMDNIFNITGYPTGFVDYRTIIENYSSDYAAKLIVNAAKETESNYPTKTGISFTSTVSGSQLNLNVKLYIKEKGDYKVTAVLLEDNIIGYQNGGGDSYNHSSIARVALSDITGDAVSTSEDNKTVSKSYTATIPSSCDKNNLRILVYVLKQYGSQTVIRTADYGEYYVDNAVSAPTGRTQSLVFSDGTVYGGNEGIKDGGEITLK